MTILNHFRKPLNPVQELRDWQGRVVHRSRDTQKIIRLGEQTVEWTLRNGGKIDRPLYLYNIAVPRVSDIIHEHLHECARLLIFWVKTRLSHE